MAQQINQAGNFQGQIVEYGLREYEKPEGNSLAIAIRARLDNVWNAAAETWEDWTEHDIEATGFIFIVKKNGQPNNAAVESLVKFAGWDGSLNSVVNQTWAPKECQFSIEANEYQGKTTYRIGFINDRDRIPGASLANVDVEKAKILDAKYGGLLRAVAGSVKLNGAPTPAAKSMPAPKKQPAKEPARVGADQVDKDIPF